MIESLEDNRHIINRRLCIDALNDKEYDNFLKLEVKDKNFYKTLRKLSTEEI